MALNVTHREMAVQTEVQTTLEDILNGSSPQSSLVSWQDVEAAAFLRELKNVSDWCRKRSKLLKLLEENVGKEGMYQFVGFSVNSIHIYLRVCGDEGLQCLQRDIQRGMLGKRLGEVLISERSKAKYPDCITMDINIEEGSLRNMPTTENPDAELKEGAVADVAMGKGSQSSSASYVTTAGGIDSVKGITEGHTQTGKQLHITIFHYTE